MSIDGSSHTFSSVTVGGDSSAHLGNNYTLQYSAYNAREAVYQSTLSTTIRYVLKSKDLQRALLAVHNIDRRAASHDERSRMLRELEKLLSRLQEMEQRGLNDISGARDFLEAAEDDFKTSEYKKAVGETLLRIEKFASKTCTTSQSDICLDEFCELVQRMSKQVSARLCVKEAMSRLSPDGRAQQGTPSDRTPLLLSASSRQTVAPVDAAEYVYASQDFWRQLALVLKEIMSQDMTYNFDWFLGYLVVFAISAIFALTFLITMSTTDAPEDDRKTVPLTAFVFFFFPGACIWTVISILRSCGYEVTDTKSEGGTNQSSVVDGTV